MSVVEKIAYTTSCVTTLPFLERVQERRSTPSGLSIYLPTVGLIIGILLAAEAWLFSAMHINQLLSAVMLSVSWLVLTGGIHLDGLMDTADGIFSHQSRERMLEIMKDSRVGNFGVMAGFVTLTLKCVSLAVIPSTLLPVMLLIQPAWSRWCEVVAIAAYPYLRSEGLGKVWHDTTKPKDIVLSLFVPGCVTVAALLFGVQNVILLVGGTIIFGLAAAWLLNRKLGGHTGDTYGATVELAEALGLLVVAIALSAG